MKIKFFSFLTFFFSCFIGSCSQNSYFKINIEKNWPKEVKEFYAEYEKLLNMDIESYSMHFESLSIEEYRKYLLMISTVISYDPKFLSYTSDSIRMAGVDVMKKHFSTVPSITWITRILRAKFYLSEYALAVIPYYTIIHVNSVDTYKCPHFSGDSTTMIRIRGKILDELKVKNSTAGHIDFYYNAGWSGAPLFRENEICLVLLHWREFGKDLCDLYDLLCNSQNMGIGLYAASETNGGKFEIQNNKIIDPINFFGQGNQCDMNMIKDSLSLYLIK